MPPADAAVRRVREEAFYHDFVSYYIVHRIVLIVVSYG